MQIKGNTKLAIMPKLPIWRFCENPDSNMSFAWSMHLRVGDENIDVIMTLTNILINIHVSHP